MVSLCIYVWIQLKEKNFESKKIEKERIGQGKKEKKRKKTKVAPKFIEDEQKAYYY